jgi:hypothetical protein
MTAPAGVASTTKLDQQGQRRAWNAAVPSSDAMPAEGRKSGRRRPVTSDLEGGGENDDDRGIPNQIDRVQVRRDAPHKSTTNGGGIDREEIRIWLGGEARIGESGTPAEIAYRGKTDLHSTPRRDG